MHSVQTDRRQLRRAGDGRCFDIERDHAAEHEDLNAVHRRVHVGGQRIDRAHCRRDRDLLAVRQGREGGHGRDRHPIGGSAAQRRGKEDRRDRHCRSNLQSVDDPVGRHPRDVAEHEFGKPTRDFERAFHLHPLSGGDVNVRHRRTVDRDPHAVDVAVVADRRVVLVDAVRQIDSEGPGEVVVGSVATQIAQRIGIGNVFALRIRHPAQIETTRGNQPTEPVGGGVNLRLGHAQESIREARDRDRSLRRRLAHRRRPVDMIEVDVPRIGHDIVQRRATDGRLAHCFEAHESRARSGRSQNADGRVSKDVGHDLHALQLVIDIRAFGLAVGTDDHAQRRAHRDQRVRRCIRDREHINRDAIGRQAATGTTQAHRQQIARRDAQPVHREDFRKLGPRAEGHIQRAVRDEHRERHLLGLTRFGGDIRRQYVAGIRVRDRDAGHRGVGVAQHRRHQIPASHRQIDGEGRRRLGPMSIAGQVGEGVVVEAVIAFEALDGGLPAIARPARIQRAGRHAGVAGLSRRSPHRRGRIGVIEVKLQVTAGWRTDRSNRQRLEIDERHRQERIGKTARRQQLLARDREHIAQRIEEENVAGRHSWIAVARIAAIQVDGEQHRRLRDHQVQIVLEEDRQSFEVVVDLDRFEEGKATAHDFKRGTRRWIDGRQEQQVGPVRAVDRDAIVAADQVFDPDH